MITTSTKKPLKEEFRITKTDVKKALQSILNSNIYKLTKEFQNILDYMYSSLRYEYIQRLYSDEGVCTGVAIHYVWIHREVVFHKMNVCGKWVFASNYENTTSDDFNYTLMNTMIPILTKEHSIERVVSLDSFE